MHRDTIERSALGNPIGLGVLYDACTDKSCNLSILRESPPPSNCISITEIPNTESDYVHAKTASDRFNSLNVTAELQVSFLAGLGSVRGFGKYFQMENTSSRSVSVSLIHKITTKYENLRILDDRLRENIDLDALKHRSATHVVTGVTWGANLIVTAEYTNEEKRDRNEVAGNLEVQLKQLACQPQGSANLNYVGRENNDNCKFKLEIVGDFLISDSLPQTIEGAMALVADLSTNVERANQGKGVPLRYELTSLEAVQAYFSFNNVQIDSLLHNLEESVYLQLTTVFDHISEAKQKLNDICNDVEKYEDVLPENMRMEIRNLRLEAELAVSEFRSDLQSTLVQVRSGNADKSQLEVIKNKYESGPYSASNALLKLSNNFQDVHLKLDVLQQFTFLGVSTISRQVRSLATKLLEFTGKQVFVLFGESEAMKSNGSLWEDHLFALRTLAQDPAVMENSKFLFVDLDSTPYLKPHQVDGADNRICLQRFNHNGQCMDQDAYKTFVRERSLNYARSVNVSSYTPNPLGSAIIRLPCTASLICGPQVHQWTCFECKKVMEWDCDEFFYCSCGGGPAHSYTFRCANIEHGYDFLAFTPDALRKLLRTYSVLETTQEREARRKTDELVAGFLKKI